MNTLNYIALLITLPFSMSFAADTNEKTLVELLKDDKVSAAYSDCKDSSDKTQSLEDCIWSKLDETKREEVKKKMAMAKEGSSEKNNKTEFESLDLTSGLKKIEAKTKDMPKDPALLKLEEFLAKRLDETLYGDTQKTGSTDPNIKVVNHTVFYDLQESQIAKNVISAISSYCIRTDENYLIDESQKKKNIENLKNFTETQNEKGEKENINASYSHWEGCAGSIKKVCEGSISDDLKESSTDKNVKKKFLKSQKEACLVTKNISNARQVLLKLGEIKKGNAENSEQSGTSLQGKKKATVYSGAKEGKDGKNIDDLTSLTSGELAKSNYDKGIEEKKKLLEACKTAGAADTTECKKIFLTGEDAEAEKKNIDEYMVRTKVLEEKISPDKISNDEVSSYLKEQGYDETKIKAMIENNLEEIKKKMANRFKEESEAIKAELKKKLEEKTISPNDSKDKTVVGSRVDNLVEEIQGKPEELKELIHYNNIVSGFLSIDSGDKSARTQNVATISRELDSDGVTEEEKKKNVEMKADFIAKGVKLENSTDATSATLSVQTINESLLNYTPPEEKTPEKKN